VPSSKKRQRKKTTRRAASRRSQKNSGLKTYGLIAAVIVVAVAVVAAIALLGQGTGNAPNQPEGVSLDKSKGAEDAPIVVVVYSDFQCPYCRLFATGPERQLQEEYVDQGLVRFVYRHLAFIGNESTWAAEASECANEQGRFWDYHDKLFEEQGAENSGAFGQDNLKRFAADLGLDSGQFDQCLDSGKYQGKVQDEGNEARRRSIGSTPSLLVNGQLINRGSDYQVLKAAIERELGQQ